jgi:diguanylate cyclase
MGPRIDQDTVATMAKKALVLMSQREIPLCPENYLVWFGHIIGINEDLDADINRIIKEGGPFSEEVNLDLFQRHFGKDTRLKLVQDAQKENQKILEDVLDKILQTQNFTSDYQEKLKGFTAQLKEARGLDEIQKVVADLMLVTVEVIQTSEKLKEHMAETTVKSENLQRDLEKAQQEVLIDPLTLLYNRKAFDKKITTYLKDFQEEGIGFSAVMIDIDFFKQFNDLHGHLLGDKVLKFMGSLLSKEIKGKDFVARYGGEEFIILLSGTSLKKAFIVADNIRKSLDGVQLKYVKTGQLLGKITISAGVSAVRKGDTEESLVKRADDALYLAKQSGRNTLKSEQHLSNHHEKPEMVAPLMVEFSKR